MIQRSLDFTAPARPVAEEGPKVLRVAELNRALKRAVDTHFAQPLWVEGEVTDARPATSGHLYFCLRDEKEEAAIDVAMFRANITPRARTLIRDGARVKLRVKPTFWEPRGRLQLVCDRADAVGKGALLEALERLKERLTLEGLFAPERKRPLPREPRIIGVVTSAKGAVIHDVCRVAFRRGGAHILLAPAVVQGAEAPTSIVRALARLAQVRGIDVIIVGRGGGSSEDLAAFNDEAVVRAVAACAIPIVSAVGHEVDTTLTDYAADARAATPSQAAEMLVPNARERRERLAQATLRLTRAMGSRIDAKSVSQAKLARRLGDPRLAIWSHRQLIDERATRLLAAIRAAGLRAERALGATYTRLIALHPQAALEKDQAAVQRAHARLEAAMQATLNRRGTSLESSAARLDAMSPLKVLGRGYAIALRADGRAVRSGKDVAKGEKIFVRVQDANISAKVVGVVGVDEVE